MKTFWIAVAGACGLLASIPTAHAQTAFAWPDTTVNLSGYHYLDNCVVVGGRVWDSVRSAQAIIPDTVFSARGRLGEAPPTKVQTSLRECLSQYTPTNIARDYALIAQQAYLYAGQYAEATAVVSHGLSQISATDTAARTAFLDSAIQQYTSIPPYQLQPVIMYLDTLERFGAAYRPWNLYRDYFWLMHAAYMLGEDSIAIRAGHRMFDLGPAASKSARGTELAAVGVGLAWALRITRGHEVLDSLRKGTAAYAELVAANFRQALGFLPAEQAQNMEAPVLQGDYWFPHAAIGQEYPKKGRISMVVFMRGRGTNIISFSMLRRLSQKYPMVDLVLLTSTEGHYGSIEPPTPEREAFLTDSVFRHFHRLNPVLSVTKGSYVPFDAPDNRRFYQVYPNEEAYPPVANTTYGSKGGRIYLIDADRRIVDILNMNILDEGWTMRLIETLLARTTGGQQQ